MSFYNTGNPVPSIDPRDLDDNAKHIDELANSTSLTFVDRLGAERRTLAGIEADADAIVLRDELADPTDPSKGAALVGYKQSTLAAAVGRTVYDRLKEFVSVEDYRVMGDDAATLQAAINAAHTLGVGLDFPPGKTYTVEQGVQVTDVNLILRFNGGRIVRGNSCPNIAALTVNNTLGTIMSVTSLTAGTFDYSGDGSLSDVSVIVLTDASSIAVGDFIKIVADDLIPSSPPANNERIGEIFQVGAKSVNTIYTTVPLREAYVTNIRLAEMPKNVCEMYGADFSDLAGFPANRGAALLQINSSIRPFLHSPKIHDGASFGVIFKNCYQPTTIAANCYSLRTDSPNLAFGYGIYEISCTEGLHTAPRVKLMRHGYTTGCLSTATPGTSALFNYGGVMHSVVQGGYATEMENAPWDTHEDSLHVRFFNCVAIGKQSGAGNSRFGIQLRGRGDEAVDCLTEGVAAGKVVQAYLGTYTAKIKRHRHRMSNGITQTSGLFGITGTASVQAKVEISADVEGGVSEVISALFADITSEGIKAVCRYGSVASYSPIRLESSSHFTGALDIDISNATGLNTRVFKTVDSTSSAKVTSLRVRRGAVGAWYVGDLTSLDGRITVDRLDCDILPVATAGGFINIGASATRFITDVVVDQFGRYAGIGALINGTNTLNTFSFEVQILDVAMTANRVVNLPSNAIPLGKRFIVRRSVNATGAFTLDVGGVSSLTAADTSTEVVWDGTVWLKLR